MKEIYKMKFNNNCTTNNNGRIYPRELFEKYVNDFNIKILKEKLKKNRKEKIEKLENVQIRNDGMV